MVFLLGSIEKDVRVIYNLGWNKLAIYIIYLGDTKMSVNKINGQAILMIRLRACLKEVICQKQKEATLREELANHIWGLSIKLEMLIKDYQRYLSFPKNQILVEHRELKNFYAQLQKELHEYISSDYDPVFLEEFKSAIQESTSTLNDLIDSLSIDLKDDFKGVLDALQLESGYEYKEEVEEVLSDVGKIVASLISPEILSEDTEIDCGLIIPLQVVDPGAPLLGEVVVPNQEKVEDYVEPLQIINPNSVMATLIDEKEEDFILPVSFIQEPSKSFVEVLNLEPLETQELVLEDLSSKVSLPPLSSVEDVVRDVRESSAPLNVEFQNTKPPTINELLEVIGFDEVFEAPNESDIPVNEVPEVLFNFDNYGDFYTRSTPNREGRSYLFTLDTHIFRINNSLLKRIIPILQTMNGFSLRIESNLDQVSFITEELEIKVKSDNLI